MYSVVTSDGLLAGAGHSQPAAADNQETPLEPTATLAQPAGCSGSTLAEGSGWHQRRVRAKQPATAPSAAHAAAAANPAVLPCVQLAEEQCVEVFAPTTADTSVQKQAATAGAADGCSSEPLSAHDTEQDDTESQHAGQAAAASDDWLDNEVEVPASDTTAAAASSLTPALSGVAQLVIHPSGSISGYFIELDSGTSSGGKQQDSNSRQRVCLGLQGRQVLGIHSCYRDPEWALLQLSIIRYGSSDAAAAAAAVAASSVDVSGITPAAPSEPCLRPAAAAPPPPAPGSAAAQGAAGAAGDVPAALDGVPPAEADVHASTSQAEAVAWVQRKGGDLVTLLPADLDDEDTEAAVLAENLGELPPNVDINFTAHTLLAGAAAAKVLAQAWPELGDNPDVVVNLGDMRITGLPVGFLDCS